MRQKVKKTYKSKQVLTNSAKVGCTNLILYEILNTREYD